MKFALGMFSLINCAASMQLSVAPLGEIDVVQDDDVAMVQNDVFCDVWDGCDTEFDMSGGTPVSNNLDGQGPDKGDPAEIRFKNAATIKCQSVDLVLKTTDDYTPGMIPPTNNGGDNGFGSVSVASGTSTELEISIVDSNTGAPVNVDELTIWIYDIDMGKKGNGKEYTEICGADVQPLDANTELEEKVSGGCTTYSATKQGKKKDNPTDRNALTDLQKKRAIKATWTGTSKAPGIRVGLGAGGSGRGFQFTATAKTLCTTTTTTPPYSTPKPRPVAPDAKCQDANGGDNCTLDDLCKEGVEIAFFKHNIIHNNLGGMGPNFNDPPVLQYKNAAEHKGRSLDLVVSASDAYKSSNFNFNAFGVNGQWWAAKYNGVADPDGAGEIGSLNTAAFDVTFKLVYTDTQEPAVVPHWDMTYYDLDGNFESVDTCDAVSAVLENPTEMQGPGCSGGCCKMKGAYREFTEPTSWDNMAAYYKKDAVTFVFQDKSQATFHYKNTGYHRVWFFKGSKVMACGER